MMITILITRRKIFREKKVKIDVCGNLREKWSYLQAGVGDSSKIVAYLWLIKIERCCYFSLLSPLIPEQETFNAKDA